MGAEAQVLHILVVPFQQEGHINGMLRLAQALVAAQKGVLVTFAYPAHFHSLAHKRNKLFALDNSLSLRIEVVEDGLPPGEEQTLTHPLVLASIPIYQQHVKLLLDRLLLHTKLPAKDHDPASVSGAHLPPLSCIISDTFLPWMQDLANAAALPRVDFWTSTAASYSMGTQLAELVSKGILPLPNSCWANAERMWKAEAPLIGGVPGLPPFPATDFPDSVVVTQADNVPLRFMLEAFGPVRQAHTILVHTVYELESHVLDALHAHSFPVYAVGPFLDQDPVPPPHKHDCLQWLDTQPPSSVIYIALGTISKLDAAELHALALGLEASKHPFLWVIRPDSISSSSSLADALPDGFLQRTATIDGGSGRIIPWAPQREVLRHSSVGAFFSHCGWNSTMECMWEGVPMVACPRMAEQRSNAKWIVENWKIGVELERRDDGSFTQEAVQRALQEVVRGHDYKERALHAKQVARTAVQPHGASHDNLISFLNRMRHPVAPMEVV